MMEGVDRARSTQQINLFRLKLSVQLSIAEAGQNIELIQQPRRPLNAADREFRRENVQYRRSKSADERKQEMERGPRSTDAVCERIKYTANGTSLMEAEEKERSSWS